MPTPDTHVDQARVDQAIEWLVQLRFSQPSPRTQQRFQHWLNQHPQNAQAWARVESMSDEFASLPRDLSRHTLDGSQRRRISRRDSLKFLAVLGAVGGLGYGARNELGLPALLADQHTATGERRTLKAADGSAIQLNTDSAVDLNFDQDHRVLTLVRGEIAVDTPVLSGVRPLHLRTRDAFLKSAGGRFLVREQAGSTLLAVRQGDVSLFQLGKRGSPPIYVAHAGETLQFDARGQVRPAITHGDPWGWSEGVLSVQQMPLGEFIAELSRYRPGLLRCADEVAGLKISGTYQLASTDDILTLIAQALPIRVSYRTRYWVSVTAA